MLARAGEVCDYIEARKNQFKEKVAYKGPKYDFAKGPRATKISFFSKEVLEKKYQEKLRQLREQGDQNVYDWLQIQPERIGNQARGPNIRLGQRAIH